MTYGFKPYEPQPVNKRGDWMQRIHREALMRRRVLMAPGALTVQAGPGVMQRMRIKR